MQKRTAHRHDRWEIPRTSRGWDRLCEWQTSTPVNLTALIRHETTVSRILADDGEPGSAKFRSPRRDAHKKDRRDTVILASGMFEREWARSNNRARRVWLHDEYLFRCGWNANDVGKQRVNYKVNGREICLSRLFSSRNSVTESRHRNRNRVCGENFNDVRETACKLLIWLQTADFIINNLLLFTINYLLLLVIYCSNLLRSKIQKYSV